MIWQESLYLWLLLIIPLLIGLTYWYNRRLSAKRISYFGEGLLQKLRKGFWPLGKKIRHFSLYIGLAMLIIAAAGPKIGTEVREVKRQGVDLLVALDLSASMNAEDVKPSRLDKAKRSEEHTSELQSRFDLVCRLLLEKKKMYVN